MVDDVTACPAAAAARARVDAAESDAGQVAGALGVGGALAAGLVRFGRNAQGYAVHHAARGVIIVVIARIRIARVTLLRWFCREDE